MLKRLKIKMSSDKAAVGTTETVLLIALAVFAVIVVMKYIMGPIQTSSVGIGNVITEMNPE